MAAEGKMDWGSIWEQIKFESDKSGIDFAGDESGAAAGFLAGGPFGAILGNQFDLDSIKTALADPGKFREHIKSQFDTSGGSLGNFQEGGGQMGDLGRLIGSIVTEGAGFTAGKLGENLAGLGNILDISGDLTQTPWAKDVGAAWETGGKAALATWEPAINTAWKEGAGGNFDDWYHGPDGFGKRSGFYDWDDASDWSKRLGISGLTPGFNIPGGKTPSTSVTTGGSGGEDISGGSSSDDDPSNVSAEEYADLVKDPRESALEAQRRARIRRNLANKQGKRSTIRTSGRGIR